MKLRYGQLSLGQWAVRFALCLAALLASLVATAVPPWILLIYLALLCGAQVMLTTTDAVREQRAESENLDWSPTFRGNEPTCKDHES